jgi:hypothetical protein
VWPLQSQVQSELLHLEQKWYELVVKNATIEQACAQMEADLAELGITPATQPDQMNVSDQ